MTPLRQEVWSQVWESHHNVIFFGPPGTGKSYKANQIATRHLKAAAGRGGGDRVFRVTFHPEYTYFDFVGSHRPVVGWVPVHRFTDADQRVLDREPRVYYEFCPGPFSRALVAAAKEPTAPVVLIIEEINRGNCAAIFGDVFQLLDRGTDTAAPECFGRSEYGINPSPEWGAWLASELAGAAGEHAVWKQGKLYLPGNLYLYATMNTSDQNLFPMDTAFRRRWGMEYVPVDSEEMPGTLVPLHGKDRTGVSWARLMKPLNEAIVKHKRTDDKQMGPWFVKSGQTDGLVDSIEFASKVLFYLWNDVFRDEPSAVFAADIDRYDELVRRFQAGKVVFNETVQKALAEAGV